MKQGAAQYYSVPNDGATWRCAKCRREYGHMEVIYVKPFQVVCLTCVDPQILKWGKYMGVKK